MHIIRIALGGLLAMLWTASPAWAQFETGTEGEPATQAVTLAEDVVVQKVRIGMEVTARGGPCMSMIGTAPVPMNWPEQEVEIVQEDISANVRRVEYRTLAGGARQMVVHIPRLAPNEVATAVVTFQIKRRAILPPDDVSELSVPKKVDRSMQVFLGASPYIETRHQKFRTLARELGPDLTGWAKVEAIYDGVREKIEYQTGPIKSAVTALNDGTGDCEELSSVFVAVCRAADIPARVVWVDGHCYPEFYLVDNEGQGHWYPCQAAGSRAFGGISEFRPILQKGDNFRDPDRPKERLRYVNENLKGATIRGGGQPRVNFIREPVH